MFNNIPVALCIFAFMAVVQPSVAQEDATTKKANLDREMTLEREYDPSVQDASKVNTLPVVKQPVVNKRPISYSNYTLAADPDKQITLFPSGNAGTQTFSNERRGYFNAGFGTYMNINGDFGYHILSTEKDRLNVFLSHRSTNGDVEYLQEDLKVKAKLNDNLGGVNYAHEFSKSILRMGMTYGYTGFNYYGLTYSPSSVPSSRETNDQVNQAIRANIGIESKTGYPFGYLLNLDYTNFSQKHAIDEDNKGITEQTIALDFDLYSTFQGNKRIGLVGKADLFSYSGMPPGGVSPGGIVFDTHAEIILSPYLDIEGESWNVKLGANLMFITGTDSEFYASPNISADVEIAPKTVLYAKATGSLQSNSAYDLSLINRYAAPIQEAQTSGTWLDAELGIKSAIAPGFWFDLFGGYKITSNDLFFVPLYSSTANVSGFFNHINSKKAFGGVSLKYSYQHWLDLNIKGVYNHWTADRDPPSSSIKAYKTVAYGKPEMEINAGITVRPLKPLAISLDYYLATGRKTIVGDVSTTDTSVALYEGYDMKNISALNLKADYTFNKTVGVYARLNNLLFQEYELLHGYPVQGFNAMVGVNLNF